MNINKKIWKNFYGKVLASKFYPSFFKIKSNDVVVNLGCGYNPQALVYKNQYKKMYSLDICSEAINFSKIIKKKHHLDNLVIIEGNVEKTGLKNDFFDKALAIDIIEHVQSPAAFCKEINRILKKKGRLLITFPAMHDKYTNIGKFILKKKNADQKKWDPGAHNHDYRISQWLTIIKKKGFKLIKMQCTTMFPPLHLIGVPRFWFSNEFVHKIDSFFCRLPIINRLGQTMICTFEKNG